MAVRRHVLIDFGSTSLPKRGGFSMEAVARDIKETTGGKLTAVVATHRHRDHISGFGGKTGKIIADLNPDVVVQPWTEHPDARPGAKAPTGAFREWSVALALAALLALAAGASLEGERCDLAIVFAGDPLQCGGERVTLVAQDAEIADLAAKPRQHRHQHEAIGVEQLRGRARGARRYKFVAGRKHRDTNPPAHLDPCQAERGGKCDILRPQALARR